MSKKQLHIFESILGCLEPYESFSHCSEIAWIHLGTPPVTPIFGWISGISFRFT